ncbi:hypothetical protein PoB_007116000 [Plakobranchus ocellatus]|uniref:Uncharacterized protein n=1 Tax=Plakobranchus ocellatus TaxID=259542 RepID=A0AAV4DKV7_9GAST|nr:hypothetical protein PoB_007116000 [Plakobranchus ocellatus]
MVRESSSDESMIGCDVLCCDVVLWPMKGRVLAFYTARDNKSCAACRVPSTEGPPKGPLLYQRPLAQGIPTVPCASRLELLTASR